ncbi:hypothetical protein NQ318_002648 [Aromia moschata]|uniref:Uncharacterized protein n=1 Tax=Aromia moschata TaxID=1265417 RepID=A0AAV8Y9K6_9CUCU|nr:hypothetical protein NQ318_002648 [Aromia moschata]
MLKNIILLCAAIINTYGSPYNRDDWDGKWFPHSPNEPDVNPKAVLPNKSNHLFDAKHGIVMGVKDSSCDDGEANRSLYLPKSTIHPIHSFDHIPAAYHAPHKCMNESINYSEAIPTL